MSGSAAPLAVPLESLQRCFQGLIPATIATCDPQGNPNVTFLSQVHYVDAGHVALSCQFFNKTRRNVEVNPPAHLEVLDPHTLELYRLRVRYTHSESSGPLYESMSLRIQAIASVTGMENVFRLLSADVYAVESVERVPGFLAERPSQLASPPRSEFALRQVLGVQIVSQQINRARDLDETLEVLLKTLDDVCGFGHSMMMVPDETGRRLVAIASRGYGAEGRKGIGAEVVVGEGFIGTVAAERQVLRISGMDADLRYGRAIRQRAESSGHGAAFRPEIPLPGLPDAQSHLALPLVVQDRLVGVLALESRDILAFGTWDEALLQILANQIAIALDKMAAKIEHEEKQEEEAEKEKAAARASGGPAGASSGAAWAASADDATARDASPPAPAASRTRTRAFTFFRNDDCVFVDGEYLIRNVPGKILWKLLTTFQKEGRTEFTNRELRLDPQLGLPPVKNNLESRLILLRRRLEEHCPDLRLVPVRRGRFALEVACPLALTERETG